MRPFAFRIGVALAVVTVTVAAAAGALAAKAAPLRIAAPGRVLQGKVAVVSVKTKAVGCTLSVRYADGDKQNKLLPTRTANGKVTWQWQVPDFAAAGQARLTVACPGGGAATKPVIVVGGLVPPKVTVVKQGFSTQVQGSRENVSYGLVLQNPSPNANALDVGVLVNFVLPDDHLIGSASATIPIINAGSTVRPRRSAQLHRYSDDREARGRHRCGRPREDPQKSFRRGSTMFISCPTRVIPPGSAP